MNRDEQLRRAGFRIHSRKRGEQPVWKYRGALLTQAQAEAIVDGRSSRARSEAEEASCCGRGH